MDDLGDVAVDPAVLQRLQQMQATIDNKIKRLENDFQKYQQPPIIKSAPTENSPTPAHNAFSHAPHWDQVLQFIRNDQEEEAIYALVRVVQRLLDEKASKKTLAEKANKVYVDDLFQLVAKGVKDNLKECTEESLVTLNERIKIVHTKITNMRKFMQNELNSIELQIQNLREPNAEQETQSRLDHRSEKGDKPVSFTVHPNRQTLF